MCVRVGGKEMTLKEKKKRRKKSAGPHLFFELSISLTAPDRLTERPRFPDQSFKSIYKCTKPDTDRLAHGHSV